jgi:transcriptional regulator with XRE-family HTH domain
MTQSEVAKRLGITYQAYQNFESGKRMLKSTTIIKLRDIFNATADEILGLPEI